MVVSATGVVPSVPQLEVSEANLFPKFIFFKYVYLTKIMRIFRETASLIEQTMGEF